MRSRNIKPSFWKNEELSECSAYARLLYIGLWQLCDWTGRMECRPKRIRAEIFPYEHVEILDLLNELETHGFIERYRDGAYLQIPTFTIHQSPHPNEKAVPSNVPVPLEDGTARELQRPTPAVSCFLNPDVLIADTPTPEAPPEKKKAPKAKEEPAHEQVRLLWNELAEQSGLNQCAAISSGRKTHLNKRLKEPYWRDNHKDAIEKLKGIRWIRGENKHKWKATFDWFLRPDTVAKIMEGTHDDSRRDFSCPSPDDSAGLF